MYEPSKVVETEFSSSPSNYRFEENYETAIDWNVTDLKNENEMLKQRLEMSEKLLFMFLQQRMPNDNNNNLYLNQGPIMQGPEAFLNIEQTNYGFSGFAQIEEDNRLF